LNNRCISCGTDLTDAESYPAPRAPKNNRVCVPCFSRENYAKELKILETLVYRAVSDIHGVVTKRDNERIHALRKFLGVRWDAACQIWRPWSEE
jgi:hypothetical protein